MSPYRTYRLTAGLAILGGVLLFGSVLAGRDRLAFRDVGHFYGPLYDYLGQRTANWRLPLWNSLDHTGVPVLGETTTAMFYPPRLVFVLPIAPSVAMGLYVVIHLVLAAVATAWAATVAGCRGAAVVFASLAYALACPTVFLYCNPPFLVGAAWLPLGLAMGLRLLESSSGSGIRATALAFAMPVLGGDPQTPLHIAVFLGLLWAVRKVRSWRSLEAASKLVDTRLLPLLAAVALAVMLALPQVAASLDWSRHSDRRFNTPEGVYSFSVAPWHWADLLVPTSNGQLFPQFQRLSVLIPGDSRIWSVSLYGGVLTLLLCGLRYCKRRGWGAWEGLAPLGIVMAMGMFGPVWLLQGAARIAGAGADGFLQQIDPASGSPYWLLSHLLPGYDSFRYPAKWLPFVSLGLAITAGRQLQWMLSNRQPSWRYFAIVSVGLLVVSLPLSFSACRDRLLMYLPGDPVSDTYWGPLDRAGGLADLAYSLRHVGWVTAVAASILAGMVYTRRLCYRDGSILLCALLFADLLVANAPHVATVSRKQEALWEARFPVAPPELARQQTFLRTGDEAPQVWQQTSVFTRIAEVAASERIGMQGRWHLSQGQGVFNSATSITPQRYQSFATASTRFNAQRTLEEQRQFWMQVGGYWGLTAYLHTSRDAVKAQCIDGRPARLMDTQTHPLAPPSAKVRWNHRWQSTAPRPEVTQQAWVTHFATLLNASRPPAPIVEIPAAQATAPETEVSSDMASAPVLHAVAEDAESLRLTVHTGGSGLLSRPTFQDGHWHCRYRVHRVQGGASRWRSASVYPVDYLGQGVLLPKGDWEVEFWYRPWWLIPSMLASSLSLLGLFVAPTAARLRRRYFRRTSDVSGIT